MCCVPKDVSKGKRRGRRTSRASMRSIFIGRALLAQRRASAARRAGHAGRQKPKIWWRWPSITKPMSRASSSCSRSISGLENSKMSPQELADEVVVVGALVVDLEAALPVEGQLAREPRLLQQLQGR